MTKSNANLIAKRYSNALFTLASEKKNIHEVYSNFKNIFEILRASEEFRKFLNNPVITTLKRKIILEEMFKDKLHILTYRYLLFLQEKNRLYLLESICQHFEDLYFKATGILKVKITTSVPMDQREASLISQHLKLKFKNEIDPELHVDPEMMGGLKTQVGDFVYDDTISKQLEKFRKNIIAAHI